MILNLVEIQAKSQCVVNTGGWWTQVGGGPRWVVDPGGWWTQVGGGGEMWVVDIGRCWKINDRMLYDLELGEIQARVSGWCIKWVVDTGGWWTSWVVDTGGWWTQVGGGPRGVVDPGGW